MFKFLLGAAAVVALVAYGIITPKDIEDAGVKMKSAINDGATLIQQKTAQ